MENKTKINIILILLLLPFVYSTLDECKGTVGTDEIPCYIILPNNITETQCSTINVSYYNQSTYLYSEFMTNYSSFSCNSTFRRTELDTYVFRYSTGDSGSIIVEEGNTMYIAIGIVLGVLLLLLAVTVFKEDMIISNIASIGLMVMGVYIMINGMGTTNNLFTDAFGIILLGIGFYIIFRVNYENWK